jgi:MFS family permease
MMKAPDTASRFAGLASFVLSALASLLAAFFLFSHLLFAYRHTPPDPQKAVGYFLIAIYSLGFAGFVFGALSILVYVFVSGQYRSQPTRRGGLLAVAGFLASVATIMVLKHPS